MDGAQVQRSHSKPELLAEEADRRGLTGSLPPHHLAIFHLILFSIGDGTELLLRKKNEIDDGSQSVSVRREHVTEYTTRSMLSTLSMI